MGSHLYVLLTRQALCGSVGTGGMAAAEHLDWVLDQQDTIQAAAEAAEDANDPHLRFHVQCTQAWIRYFSIIRYALRGRKGNSQSHTAARQHSKLGDPSCRFELPIPYAFSASLYPHITCSSPCAPPAPFQVLVHSCVNLTLKHVAD